MNTNAEPVELTPESVFSDRLLPDEELKWVGKPTKEANYARRRGLHQGQAILIAIVVWPPVILLILVALFRHPPLPFVLTVFAILAVTGAAFYRVWFNCHPRKDDPVKIFYGLTNKRLLKAFPDPEDGTMHNAAYDYSLVRDCQIEYAKPGRYNNAPCGTLKFRLKIGIGFGVSVKVCFDNIADPEAVKAIAEGFIETDRRLAGR